MLFDLFQIYKARDIKDHERHHHVGVLPRDDGSPGAETEREDKAETLG